MNLNKKIDDMLIASARAALAGNSALIDINCESPIEVLFANTMWARGVWTERVEFHHTLQLQTLIEISKVDMTRSIFCAQVAVGGWRVDFVLVAPMSGHEPPLVVAIECDGHDFHEKTKEQVRKDKARERDIVATGCKVLRFSGSEIWCDPVACVDCVLALVGLEAQKSQERHSGFITKEFGSFDKWYQFRAAKTAGAN